MNIIFAISNVMLINPYLPQLEGRSFATFKIIYESWISPSFSHIDPINIYSTSSISDTRYTRQAEARI